MDESFKIPIDYEGQNMEFDAKLVLFGYSQRFVVDIEGIEVYFEPDEDRQYRAILSDEAIVKGVTPKVELVKLIGQKINLLAAKK